MVNDWYSKYKDYITNIDKMQSKSPILQRIRGPDL